jgi:glycosyltransferase involved in cell wall biosynthesis
VSGLRIGLDARMVGPVVTGLGRYARALVEHLPPLDPSNRYIVIHRRRAPMPLGTAPNIEHAVVEGDIDQPANLVAAPAINRLRLDLYHSLYDFVPPGLRAGRIVLTLHDLTWLEQPDLCFDERFAWVKARITTLYAWATMPYAARRADRIITVSAHTRDRGMAVLGLDPARVRVVHHGLDHDSFPPACGEAAAGAPYFLCLGNTKPYKNTRAAIEAFAQLVVERPACRLVITGRGDSRESLGQLAARLGVAAAVRFTGPVSHPELLDLLHGAVALVFPSLVEGFGLPLVEAMSAGCPVVGSAAPTVAEICGDAALLPDPTDPARIAAAMRLMLDDPSARREYRRRGFERARDFDWARCAAGTLDVYREVLQPWGHV